MALWDSIKKILNSEGADIKDGLDVAKDKLDHFLTEKETEMAATPKERMDMITEDMDATDAEFDRIVDKAKDQAADQTAESELRDALGGKAAPPAATSPSTAAAAPVPSYEPTMADDPDAARLTAEEAGAKAEAERMATEKAEAERIAAEKAKAEKAAQMQAKRAAADAKFESQKAKADDLLDELRGELGIDD